LSERFAILFKKVNVIKQMSHFPSPAFHKPQRSVCVTKTDLTDMISSSDTAIGEIEAGKTVTQ